MSVINFGAGPAKLPYSVVEQARSAIKNFHNGLSILEISHRSDALLDILSQTKNYIRELLKLPSSYEILFLPGGGRTQFAMVPMNLSRTANADYTITGVWSVIAAEEANKFLTVNKVTELMGQKDLICVPDISDWKINTNADYLHIVSNETISGLRLPNIPEVDVPLVSDMTSCIFSEPIEIFKYKLIYAAAQKNLGVAGVTLVIIDPAILPARPIAPVPSMLNYQKHIDADGVYNTVPVFPCYVMYLMLKWIVEQGGITKIYARNLQKADYLYSFIDSTSKYKNKIHPSCRSNMNITFQLPSIELKQKFLKEAEQAGFMQLSGHKLHGGIRVSIYNAMELADVKKLVQFMDEFKFD